MSHETPTRKEFLKAGAGIAAGAAIATTFGFNRLASAEEGSESKDERIIQLATFGLQEGKEAEAREALSAMVKGVEDTEPGVLVYSAHISETTSNIIFYEVYENAAALAAHGNTPHMNAMRASFMKLFKPPVNIERLSPILTMQR